MTHSKFQIFKGRDHQFYFRLIDENGNILLKSEGYVSRSGCENGIEAVMENAPKHERVERRKTEDGRFYFVLAAVNHEIIGTGVMTETETERDNTIQTVMKMAPGAEVEDISE